MSNRKYRKLRTAFSELVDPGITNQFHSLERYNSFIMEVTLDNESEKDSSQTFAWKLNRLNEKYPKRPYENFNNSVILKKDFEFSDFDHLRVLIYILRKTASARSEGELNFLATLLFKKMPAQIASIQNKVIFHDILRKFKYEFGTEERKLFNTGEIGKKFYLILDGSVSSVRPVSSSSSSSTKNFGQGDFFGENALEADTKREHSCVCLEDSHFMVLSAEDYRKCIGTLKKILLEELLAILAKSEYFKTWSLENKVILAEKAKIKEGKRGDVLFEEGEEGSSVFLVKSGEIEISQMVEVEKRETPQTMNILDHESLLSKGFESAPKHKFHETNRVWRKEAESRRRTRVRLCIMGKGQLLGVKDIFNNSKRTTKATIHSLDAVIYEIGRHLLLSIGPSKDNAKLKELFLKNDIWHETLIKNQNKLSEELCPPLTKTFYQTKEDLTDSRRMLKHIQKKNSETLTSLPTPLTINYTNKKFLTTLQSHFLVPAAAKKPDIENAAFPETTLIPFKNKLQALNIGLKMIRPSKEMKEKIGFMVGEYSNQANEKKRKVRFPLDFEDCLDENVEIKPKEDLTIIFKRKEQIGSTSKIMVENPVLAICNNLNINLFPDEKEEKINIQLRTRHMPSFSQSTFQKGSFLKRASELRIVEAGEREEDKMEIGRKEGSFKVKKMRKKEGRRRDERRLVFITEKNE